MQGRTRSDLRREHQSDGWVARSTEASLLHSSILSDRGSLLHGHAEMAKCIITQTTRSMLASVPLRPLELPLLFS